MLLDRLHMNANEKGGFAQVHVTDTGGWTRHFLVNTAALEREFDSGGCRPHSLVTVERGSSTSRWISGRLG
jgi:hypothetical protein